MSTYRYPEELITAVWWLLHKGITRSSDIARRLEVSPYTVSNIKTLLRKRGKFPEPGENRRRRRIKKTVKLKEKKEKKKEDFITVMFGNG